MDLIVLVPDHCLSIYFLYIHQQHLDSDLTQKS